MVLYGLAIFADFICPYAYQDEDRNFSYCPPTAVEFWDMADGCVLLFMIAP